jgi:hypothetical protein
MDKRTGASAMNLVANMTVRNADWIVGLSARAALMWCDNLVVMLHACSDRSAEIAEEISSENTGRVHVIVENDHGWNEMANRQKMLEKSRDLKATHIAIIDADELLTGNLLDSVRQKFESSNHIIASPLYNLRNGIDEYHINGTWGNRRYTIGFKDELYLNWSGDMWHHREPMGAKSQRFELAEQGAGGGMHFWGASEKRLKAHHAYYKLAERLRWPQKPIAEIDDMYSWAINGRTRGERDSWRYEYVPAEWWQPYFKLCEYLDIDSESWEVSECKEIIAHNPGIEQGLDLFGVIQ